MKLFSAAFAGLFLGLGLLTTGCSSAPSAATVEPAGLTTLEAPSASSTEAASVALDKEHEATVGTKKKKTSDKKKSTRNRNKKKKRNHV